MKLKLSLHEISSCHIYYILYHPASAAFSYSGSEKVYIEVNGTLDSSPFKGTLAFSSFVYSELNIIGYTPANERFEGIVTNQKFIDK